MVFLMHSRTGPKHHEAGVQIEATLGLFLVVVTTAYLLETANACGDSNVPGAFSTTVI